MCMCVCVSLRGSHFGIGRQSSNNMQDCTKRSTPSPIGRNRTMHRASTDRDALLLLQIKMDYSKRMESKLHFGEILYFSSMW